MPPPKRRSKSSTKTTTKRRPRPQVTAPPASMSMEQVDAELVELLDIKRYIEWEKADGPPDVTQRVLNVARLFRAQAVHRAFLKVVSTAIQAFVDQKKEGPVVGPSIDAGITSLRETLSHLSTLSPISRDPHDPK